MVALSALWLPILLSSVIVFVASFVIHTVLPFHKNDLLKLPNEDKVMDALRALNIAPGDYMMPKASSAQEMRSAEFLEKHKRGPVVVMTVIPSGPMSMTPMLAMWFAYCVVIGILSAYVTGRALGVGSDYLRVFRFAGTTAFIAYSAALWQASIWYRRSWGTTIRMTIDGLIYGLLTAGTFGWLWPH